MSKKEMPRYVEDIRSVLHSDPPRLLAQDLIDAAVMKVLYENGVNSHPVDVQKIGKNLGFDIFSAQMKPESDVIGMMGDCFSPFKPLNSRRFIVVDEKSDLLQRTGTIAHELGHFFIDCTSAEDYNEVWYRSSKPIEERSFTPHPITEENANLFKDELLMPWLFLRSFLEARKGKSWESILYDIKQSFGVPRHTAKAHIGRRLNIGILEGEVYQGEGL
jgi:Zn-dependent peptidase ImmA (M78 family)